MPNRGDETPEVRVSLLFRRTLLQASIGRTSKIGMLISAIKKKTSLTRGGSTTPSRTARTGCYHGSRAEVDP